jgi:Putative MetA-pathway of phenol degradation
MLKNMFRLISGGLLCLFFLSDSIHSQDLDPWIYGNLPIKLNSAAFTYGLMDGNVISDPGAPIQDFEITTHKLVAGYLRTFNVFGKLGKFQIAVPFSFMSGDLKVNGRDTSGTRTGFDDVRIRLGVNILGSPPLEPSQFRTYRQEAILGVSMVVIIPLGLYYPERLVNLGTNRWGFRPEVGVSLRLGQFYWEIYGGVKFSTANNEFLTNKTLKQDPTYTAQMHIGHTFKSNIKLALSGTYVNGGQTSINDIYQDDYIRHLRGGISVGMNITQFHLVMLQTNINITSNVSLDYKSIMLSYSYTWF